mmetsp:Transcript_9241/g.19961  ORF Transcript_9241/g.19961 Transcript_9241/m.19961 type:complete len:254 (-) Transcript_9241:980-1741(-)
MHSIIDIHSRTGGTHKIGSRIGRPLMSHHGTAGRDGQIRRLLDRDVTPSTARRVIQRDSPRYPLALIPIPKVHPARQVAVPSAHHEPPVRTHIHHVPMRPPEQEGRFRGDPVMQRRQRGHPPRNDRERHGPVDLRIGNPVRAHDGHRSRASRGGLRGQRHGDGASEAGPLAVVLQQEEEVRGAVVRFAGGVDGGLREQQGGVGAGGPLDRDFLGAEERFGRQGRSRGGAAGYLVVDSSYDDRGGLASHSVGVP